MVPRDFSHNFKPRLASAGFLFTLCESLALIAPAWVRPEMFAHSYRLWAPMARDWIAKNAGKIGAAAPTVSEGTVSTRTSPLARLGHTRL